jgi:hypothetical protein
MMCEQAGPKQLVHDVALAEEDGLDFTVISGHHFPWLEVRDLPDTARPIGVAVSGPVERSAMSHYRTGLRAGVTAGRPEDAAALPETLWPPQAATMTEW